MKYLMAIDAGTGSVRAVIFDMNGNQISLSQEEWSHIEEEGIPNSMLFDTTKNWETTQSCIRNCIEKAGIDADDILAVSATSMREGIVLYDIDSREIWAVANVDARASEEVKYLKENFKGIEEKFYSISGQTFALGALPRLLWLKNNKPKIYEKVTSISMISDWILAKLSGVIASDPSNGGTTGIFSLKERSWVASMAKEVGIKDNIFPKVLEVGEVLGTVMIQASKETTLSTQTKVVMGGGDVQMGSAGLGIIKKGQVAILGGSFWQQVVNIDSSTPPPSDMNIRLNPHVVRGLSQAEGITFFSGLVMRWFRDAFCDIEKVEAKERGVDTYTILEEKASKVPVGSYGIIPIFSDSMKYGKWYHASPSFINLSIDPNICNRASIFRSLQENACIVSYINLKKIEAFSGIKVEEIVFAGGASRGELWCQILADVTGCRVKVPKVTEATALGTAMSAGVGAGVYNSLVDASNTLVVLNREYNPNILNFDKYNSIQERWSKVYEAQLDLVDRGLTDSMWKVPGL